MAELSVRSTQSVPKRSQKSKGRTPEDSRAKRYQFRSRPRFDLSETDVKSMLEQHNLFCTDAYNFDWAHSAGEGIAHRYEVLHDGVIVLDKASGLMWQRSGSPEVYAFRQVARHVQRVNRGGFFGWRKLGGFDDWRLPTLEEAMSLIQPQPTASGFIDPVFAAHPANIFSADENYVEGRVWIVSYAGGFCCPKSVLTFLHVRLVRSAESG